MAASRKAGIKWLKPHVGQHWPVEPGFISPLTLPASASFHTKQLPSASTARHAAEKWTEVALIRINYWTTYPSKSTRCMRVINKMYFCAFFCCRAQVVVSECNFYLQRKIITSTGWLCRADSGCYSPRLYRDIILQIVLSMQLCWLKVMA